MGHEDSDSVGLCTKKVREKKTRFKILFMDVFLGEVKENLEKLFFENFLTKQKETKIQNVIKTIKIKIILIKN